MENETLLRVSSIKSGYSGLQIIWDVDLEVNEGETTILIGANGAGKTTLLKTIVGLVPAWGGKVEFNGDEITSLPLHEKSRRGIVFLSEMGVFPELSIHENLLLSSLREKSSEVKKNMERVFEIFPDLKNMKGENASSLSGGQRKMLIIARALMAKPRILILDEPSSGLSPLFVDRVIDSLKIFKEMGISMLISEQNVEFLSIADKVYGLDHGSISFSGTPDELLKNDTIREAYFGSE